MKIIYKIPFLVSAMMLFIIFISAEVSAAPAWEDNPYVMASPDRRAFTTNSGELGEWYPAGTTIDFHVESAVRELQPGEHYYKEVRSGDIPIGKWVVEHASARCVHNAYPDAPTYHGIFYGSKKCQQPYYSGWFGYCADCGECLTSMYMYMSKDAAASIKSLDLSYDYFYLCPHCRNLEQGSEFDRHKCKAISWNKYYVFYKPNFAQGYVLPSTHIYNNEKIYEGKNIFAFTKLNLNMFYKENYEFVEWNTEPNGSGESFQDGQEIINLTSVNNGVINLYAQWKRSSSTLHINPAGGKYDGNEDIFSKTDLSGKKYEIDSDKVQPPSGYSVHFETNGGTPVADMPTVKRFDEWSQSYPFHGILTDGIYTYKGKEGTEDTITAIYLDVPIILPGTARDGQQFGGWYRDAECTILAGTKGDSLLVTENTTLYAKWVSLVLAGKDNYVVYGGSGAVDLSWEQEDNVSKTYKLYQSRNKTDWEVISQSLGAGEVWGVDKTFPCAQGVRTFVVPYTGAYTLTLQGAQGMNYGSQNGGKGGKAVCRVWCSRGEILTYTVGGQNGYNGGGTGSPYGNGGGMTSVVSDIKGTLAIAGGGGGASVIYPGGSGGSAQSLTGTSNGGSGGAGGGGGCQGGNAGAAVVHNHTASCRHYHTGNSTVYGGCYTIEYTERVKCGNYNYAWTDSYNAAWPGGYCVRCNVYTEVCWHTDDHYRCSGCGSTSGSSGAHNIDKTSYTPGCGLTNGQLICMYYNKPDGYVISAYPAYGGSNYVNTAYCAPIEISAGQKTGDGELGVKLINAEYFDSRTLSNVKAPDLAAPDAIDMNAIQKTAVAGDKVNITWKAPADNGTEYYHRAESYSAANGNKVCDSNITLNTLTSGIAGYGCIVDNNPLTKVIRKEKDSFIEEASMDVLLTEKVQYFHVAPIDVAGNIGKTAHVKIGTGDTEVAWPIMTTPIRISSEEDSVYPAEGINTYFVRADGITPFMLEFGGFVENNATKSYQINHLIFDAVMEEGGENQKFKVDAPLHNEIADTEIEYDSSSLRTSMEGTLILEDGSYTAAKRSNYCKNLQLNQKFLLPADKNGKPLLVTPIAGADFKNTTRYSNLELDGKNAIRLIPDAEAPVIYGTDAIKDWDLIIAGKEEIAIDLQFTCSDALSGVKEFYAEIVNTDNFGSKVYYPAEDGSISITITDDDILFNGDFNVIIHAADHVGNRTEELYGTTEFSLQTSVTRILSPHDPIFQCGESGILHILTAGYADRVEVTFPHAFTSKDPKLNKTYTYEIPDYLKEEELKFMVPLYVEEGEYTIEVKAYKAGVQLQDHPSLNTITVKGTVLDDFRTRLR